MKKKTIKQSIFDLNSKSIQTAIDISRTQSQILVNLGYVLNTTNLKYLREHLKNNTFDYTQYKINQKLPSNVKDLTFIENSPISREAVKKLFIRGKYTAEECSECKLCMWEKKKLPLQLDHINGIANDNRIENLRLLCANCHSQTITYSGKKK